METATVVGSPRTQKLSSKTWKGFFFVRFSNLRVLIALLFVLFAAFLYWLTFCSDFKFVWSFILNFWMV
jgi:hypothetical protein